MTWHRLARTVEAQLPLDALRSAFGRTDIFALDLDQCIFPGYTQTELGARLAWRLLRRPDRSADRRFLPQLGLGGVLFGVKEGRLLFGIDTPMRRLVAWYERVMRGVPEPYVLAAAQAVPPASFAYAADTVALLATHAPTGIVSLGLDVVLRAYLDQFRTADGPSLSYFDSNVVVFHGAAPQRTFHGYDADVFLEHGGDKRRALECRMERCGAHTPTTIGHSDDDLPLAALARERGGLAIGFNPPARLCPAFDVVVRGHDWEPMYALVAMLLAPPRPSATPAPLDRG